MQKMIANVLNNDNEGYSKLKQIVKENVKDVYPITKYSYQHLLQQ
jgi:hypothetical protein